MKTLFYPLLFLVALHTGISAAPYAGFFLPDSVAEFTMKYKTVNNLIVLPVIINDSIQINLILDTGCRNMILFGKKFESLFKTEKKPIEFSGLGSGKHVTGKLALNNKIAIGAITGQRIPIIIVPEKNLFSSFKNIHGVIGYEIFIKFEIELNFPKDLITFRPASATLRSENFDYVPMKIVDARPIIECNINSAELGIGVRELVIDTGSSLGLVLGLAQAKGTDAKAIARGLNGLVAGSHTITRKLRFNTIEFTNVATSVIFQKENYASIGMEFLKEYTVILNYPKAFVGFSKT